MTTTEEQNYSVAQIINILLAYHELGHFKGCIEGDIPVDYIVAETTFWTGQRTGGGYNHLPGGERRYLANDPEALVRMAMAGRAAEEYWLELHPQYKHMFDPIAPSRSDLAITREWIERFPYLTEKSALASARIFVRDHWEWIGHGAREFLTKDRMSRNQVLRAGRTGKDMA